MIEPFLEYIEYEKRYSQHTKISYRNDLEQFATFLDKNYQINVNQAGHQHIRAWIVSLSEQQVTSSSIARKIACLRSFYKFLMREGMLTENPTLKVRSPKVKERVPHFVQETNILNLLDLVKYPEGFGGIRDKLIIELLYGTGIRLSELINLTETDVDLYNQTIKVLGKRNKQRLIPLNRKLTDLMKVYLEAKKDIPNEENLIVTDRYEKVYPMFIYRKVKHYLGIAAPDLEKKSPHVLRHTFATHLLNNGADITAIKDLLGHSTLAATQVYTHNSLEKLKAAFKQAHPKA